MELTDKLAAELDSTLNSPGWIHVIEPYMKKRLMTQLELLSAPVRPEGQNDDITRGRIDEDRFVLTTFHNMLTTRRANLDADRRNQPTEPIGTPYAAEANLPLGMEQ